MTRKQAMAAIKAAGAAGDQRAFTRIYVENRFSLQVARDAYDEGRRFAEWVKKRDSEA